jgi:2-keto-4-pentenoate hydratase/2-oxohepta-3-ene-1,7-dioic acid hydratase in catechol pathway
MTYGLATVCLDGAERVVLVTDGGFVPLSCWGEERPLPALLADWAAISPHLAKWAGDAKAFESAADFASADVRLPYRPGQVFCTGANYKKHVVGLIMGDPSMRTKEHEDADPAELKARVERMMDERAKALPFAFLKLPACAVGPHDKVILPFDVEKPDWELELGVVIGRRAHRVSEAEAMNFVAGFAVTNDVTARELIFRRDGSAIGADWLSGKSFPTFLPFGPMIVPRECIADPYDLNIRLSVNGKVYQDESTADMMASIERQIVAAPNGSAADRGESFENEWAAGAPAR